MTRKLKLATPAARAEYRQRLAEHKTQKRREESALVRRVQQALPGFNRKEIDVLVIPSGFPAASAPTQERIQEYTAHLRKMISEVDAEPDGTSARSDRKMKERAELSEARLTDEPVLRDISNRLCSMCKGGCCTAGGNAAFINSATIRSFRERRPELSDEDILHAYLSRLSAQTITGACINQSTTGCVLPTEMRSDTCNGFFCQPLAEWQTRDRRERASKVLVIQRSESYWERDNKDLPNRIVDVALVTPENSVQLEVDLDPEAG